MTTDDKKSTLGATDGTTVLAALVAGNLQAAAAFGMSAPALAAAAGLSGEALADPDGRVPFDLYMRLWQAIDADPRAEDFGFWLGTSVDIGMLGVVGFAMQHAPDVRAAFRCLDRYRKLINDQVSPLIEEGAAHVVFRRTEPPAIARLASLAVSAPLGTLTLVRKLAGLSSGEGLAVEAAFQHQAPPTAERYRAALGCPVSFGAAETRITFHRAVFDLPVKRTDPGLFAYLARRADELQSRLGESRTLSARLREVLLRDLAEGEPAQAEVARRLGLGERTLQRRLRAEGTAFATLLDEVRKELAELHLREPSLAIFEVAYLLGYSEPSAFNRAFRRWTGLSPRDYRRQLQGAGER